MIIGILELKLRIANSHSLKGKRMIIKGLKDRLHNNFNISVSETDSHNKWQLAHLAIVTVSLDNGYTHSLLSKVVDYIKRNPEVELFDYQMELI